MNRRNKSNSKHDSKNATNNRKIGSGRAGINSQSVPDFHQRSQRSDRNVRLLESNRENRDRNDRDLKRPNQRSKATAKPRYLTYHCFMGLIDKYNRSPNELLMNLSSCDGFFTLIADNERLKGKLADYEFFCHVIRCLSLIMDSDPNLLIPFITRMNGSEFEMPIMKYLISFNAFLQKNTVLHLKTFEYLVRFLSKFQTLLPNASREKVSLIYPHLNNVVDMCNKKEDIVSQTSVALVKQITSILKKANETLDFEDIKREKEQMVNSMLRPPDDYRNISICPTIEDIHQTGRPFLRSNIVKGKYVNVDHYLDVQFRLLREDFVRPLREGIAEYLSALKEKKQMRKLKDIRIYNNVHIGVSSQLSDGLITEVTFDTTPFKNLRWQFSKRLINGSMLCLSSNNFETFCFATVAGKRDTDQLAKGKFKLRFETESLTEEFIKITPLTNLTVIESQAYYEAYRHNLTALQSFSNENFPLQEYIINVSNNVQNLEYLDQSVAYDLSDLAMDLIKIKSDNFKAINDSFEAKYGEEEDFSLMDAFRSETKSIDRIKQRQLKHVNILNDTLWPDNNVCGFDDSQYQAFKTALTKQMVVIQGPPGTGKTYVGLRIVQTLLRNKAFWKCWNNNEEQRAHPSPILIVCYTNHALDQFLEGMVPFVNANNGMVRIGGRSQSDILQDYSLYNLKRRMQMRRNVPEHVFRSLLNCKKDLDLIQRQLSSAQSDIHKCDEKLLDCDLNLAIERLANQGNDDLNVILQQMKQLMSYDDNFDFALIRWLSIYDNEVSEEFYESEGEEESLDNGSVDMVLNTEINEDSNEEIEADEQEIQDIMDNRIFDDEELHENFITKKDNITVGSVDSDNEGFTFQNMSKSKRRRLQKRIEYELKSNDMMSDRQAFRIFNIKLLSLPDRWRLYRFWRQLYCHKKEMEIEVLNRQYSVYVKEYNALRVQEDLCVIRGCEIIGVTTTGAAKYRTIIEQIDPLIVVVEEAAEVLESHVVTSLTKSTQHLILIGDHQQLKPNPTVYELAKKFNLEISLFERMIKNGLPFHQLKVQHRMKPCISSLLVPHIYKELRDHDSVKHYEDIKGVTKSMFFINHSEVEASLNDTKSKLNKYEAEFIVRLCRYLVLQQYKASQITILTTYSAQLFQLKQEMRKDSNLNGVRATVLDNYQGEECDIILLSFVRSNIEGDIGFLKVSNRVNVALSRARMGMYCIANFDCLSEQSDLWKNIKKDLIEQKAIGTHLELICQNHYKKTLVSKASDFNEVPEGGCLEPCSYRLECGHVCPRACHIYDGDHKEVFCKKYCSKIVCNSGHRCPAFCHNLTACQPCSVRVNKIRPLCGHELKMKCSLDPNDAFCYEKCDKKLICGHPCRQVCGADCNSGKCESKVTIDAICGHKMQIDCNKQNNIEFQLKCCTENCGIVLKCGHPCQGSCGECQQKRLHKICGQKCGRTLICGHICKAPCGENCPPCKQKCANRCYHSECYRNCGIPCPPCLESCVWKCVHKQCNSLCNEICDRDICEESCPKFLKCKHPCIGICGEPCPKKCRVCNKIEVQEIFFGDEDEPNAKFIQLQDCGHVIEFNGLREWLKQSNDNSDVANRPNIEIQMKGCPKCKTIIRKTKLFNSSIQQSLKDVERVKLIHYGNNQQNKEKASQLRDQIVAHYIEIVGNDNNISHSGPMRAINLGRNLRLVPKELKSTFEPLMKKLIFKLDKRYISKSEVMLLENKFQIMKQLIEIKLIMSNTKKRSNPNSGFEKLNKFINEFDVRLEKFLHFIDTSFANNAQQILDSQIEINCFTLVSETFNTFNQKYFNEEGRQLLINAFELLRNFGPFTDEMKNEFKTLVDKAIKLQGGLGISNEEKEMVLKAMDFSLGHWYKCPNGHIYCISECGGAMQESTCPECGARIGGSEHTLLASNAVATEMDGATRPAFGPHVMFDLQQFIN